jgi:NADH:ubiquinone oxidoreductase subunit 4 (subunit M)
MSAPGAAPRSPLFLGLGVIASVVLWTARDHLTFTLGLIGVLLVPLLHGRHRSTGRRLGPDLVPPLLAIAVVVLHGLLPLSAPVAVAALLVVGSAFPAHLWLEALRPRIASSEFLLLLLAQPGLALAVHILDPQTVTLDLATRTALAGWFVVTAIVQTGLGLVRTDPMRAVFAIGQSQAALLIAGALVSEHGFTAEYLMLAGTDLGLATLVMALADARTRHHLDRLLPDNGMADLEPTSARLFLVAGWLFVGLPGGIVFFAEDLLFHALVQHSSALTAALILAQVLNAIGFYRVYLGVYAGRPRADATANGAMPHWLAPTLTTLILITMFLGLWPQLLLGH